MRISPIQAPSTPAPNGSHVLPRTTPSPEANSARDRAIQRLMGQPPVSDGTKVAPEESGAITSGQQDSTEAVAVPPPQEATPQSTEQAVTDQAASQEPAKAEAEAKTTEETSSPLSSQYAQLARKEKALRAQIQELKAKEDALKAQEAAIKAKELEYQSKYIPRDRLKQDALSVLNEEGITYDQLTQQALQAPQSQSEVLLLNEIKSLKSEIQSLKGEHENAKKSQVEQQQNAYKQAVAQLTREASQLVNANPEFETIKETGSVKDVVELIERTYKEEGNLLSVEEAAKLVEDHLVEEAMKIAKIKKISQRLQPAAPVQKQSEPAKQSQPVQQPLKTLTNNVSATRPLSARERAMMAFEGKLNKG